PLWCLVYIGQLELLILVLAMSSWRAAEAGRDWRAGLWLRGAAPPQPYPAVFPLPLLWRLRVRVVLGAGAGFRVSQLGGLLAVGRSDMIRYYSEILPSVSKYYAVRGLNAAPYGALLRMLGGAIDFSPLVHAPGAVVPITVAFSFFALAALVRLPPARAPVATFVLLPTACSYSVVLALPTMSELLRVPSLRRAPLVTAIGLSISLPLVNLLVGLGARLPTVLLLALQPAGMLGLLALSLRAARGGIRCQWGAARRPAARGESWGIKTVGMP